MGAGKTTLARGLAGVLGANALVEESGRHPFIKDFYSDPGAYAVETELAFLLLHYHQILREMRSGTFEATVVSDFALDRDLVFARLTLKNKEDQELFEPAYKTLTKRVLQPDILIYLRAPVEFLVERVGRRGRDYEKTITRPYIQAVSSALDAYFLQDYRAPKLVFDATELDASVNPSYLDTVTSQLVSKTQMSGGIPNR